MKKKIFLTGASGKLGSTLISYLEKNYNLISVGFKKKPKNGFKLNLTKSLKVKSILNRIKPDIIIHLAALTNVDECEKNYNKAYDLNCNTTKYLVEWAEKRNKCRFIYLSTDQVYSKSGFNSEDNPFPINLYSITKFISENIALTLVNSVIIRTNFYGFFPNHNNSLVNWFIENIRKKKEIKLIKNIFFNPLHVNQLCLYILEIIKNDKIKGVINLGSKDKISKGNLLFKIGKKLNLVKKNYVYENVENLNLNAFRPKNMLMCVKKIEKFLNKPMPKIDDGINDLISNIKINNKTGKLTNDF